MSGYRRGGQLKQPARRSPSQRLGNRIYYAVAEGTGTEYDYLRHLNRFYGPDHRFLIRLPSQRRGLSAAQVVDLAVRAAAGEDSGDVSFWALFDHDRQRDIDEVCARAKRHGVETALSHPSFELWLLLHFQDFPAAAQGGSNLVIMEKLRAAHSEFADYPHDNKRIDERRFAALREHDGIRQAVGRAQRMSSAFSSRTPDHCDPSTGVHRLIARLGIAGPEQGDQAKTRS